VSGLSRLRDTVKSRAASAWAAIAYEELTGSSGANSSARCADIDQLSL
jgi:hypothetical protein